MFVLRIERPVIKSAGILYTDYYYTVYSRLVLKISDEMCHADVVTLLIARADHLNIT